MKNLKFLFCTLLVAGFTLTSCSKDDGGGSAPIEGKWFYSKAGVSGGGQEILSDYDHMTGCEKDYIEILAGGVFKDVTHESNCDLDTDTTTWTRNGKSFTTGTGSDAETVEISKLTKSELKIKSTFSEGGMSVGYVTLFTKS